MSQGYNIYGNSGSGDPIDYDTPIATISGFATTTWTSPGLGPGDWAFGVRAFNSDGEEQNLDASVQIDISSTGQDITNLPNPPTGLRAFATPGGGIRVEWWYPRTIGPTAPVGFNVYIGSGTPDYASPAATVPFSTSVFSSLVANLSGLTGGTTYAIGVRAYNASGIEQNTATVSVTAVTIGPAPVTGLLATTVT